MPVEAVRGRPVADPVFDARRHPVRSDSAGTVLKAGDVRGHHATDEIGVLTERSVDTRPARLGGKISLWGQSHVDADSAIFPACAVCEAPHELGITNAGQAQRPRPLREATG